MGSVDGCWDKFKSNVMREIPFFRDKESWWTTLETEYGWDFGEYDISRKSKCAVMLAFFIYKLSLYKRSIKEAKMKRDSEDFEKVFSLEKLNEITLEIPYVGSRKNPKYDISREKGEYFVGRYLIEFIEIAVETLINADPSESGCYYLYQHNLEVDMTTPTLLSDSIIEDRYPLWQKNEETGKWERTDADEPESRYRTIVPGIHNNLLDGKGSDEFLEDFLDDIHESVNHELNRPSNSEIRDMDFTITLHKTLVEDYVHPTTIPDFMIYLKNFIYEMYQLGGITLDYNNKSYDEIMKMVEIERETITGVSVYGIKYREFKTKAVNQLKKRVNKIKNDVSVDIFKNPENYYHLLHLRQSNSDIQIPIKLFNLSAFQAAVSIKRNETFKQMKYMEGVFKKIHTMYENIQDINTDIMKLIDDIVDERDSSYKMVVLNRKLEDNIIKICIERAIVILLRSEAFHEIPSMIDEDGSEEMRNYPYKATIEYAIALNNVYQYEVYIQLIAKLFPKNVKIPSGTDNTSFLEIEGLNDNMDLFPDPVIFKKIFATFELIVKSLTPANPHNPPLTTVPFLHPWKHWKVLRNNDPEETFRRNIRAIINNLNIIERESKNLYEANVSAQEYLTIKLSDMSLITKKQHIEEKLENMENIYNECLRYLFDVNIFENNVYILEEYNLVSEEDVPQTNKDHVLGDIYHYRYVFLEMYNDGDLRNEMMDEVFDLKNEPIAEREYWKLWPERKSYVENKSLKRAELPSGKYKGESNYGKFNEQYPISGRQKTYLDMIGENDPIEVFKSRFKDEARKAYITQTPIGKAISDAVSQTRQPLRSTRNMQRRSKYNLENNSFLDWKRLWKINHYYDRFTVDVLKTFYMAEVGGRMSSTSNKLEMINIILKDCCHKNIPFFEGKSQVLSDEQIPSFFYGNIEWWSEKLDNENYPEQGHELDIFFYLNDEQERNKNPHKKLLSELIKEGLFTLDASDVSPTDYERMANWLFPVMVDYIQDSSVYFGYKFIFKLEPLMKLERENKYIPEVDRNILSTITEGGGKKKKTKRKNIKTKGKKKKSKKKKSKKKKTKGKNVKTKSKNVKKR